MLTTTRYAYRQGHCTSRHCSGIRKLLLTRWIYVRLMTIVGHGRLLRLTRHVVIL